jgi:hypothetical protein
MIQRMLKFQPVRNERVKWMICSGALLLAAFLVGCKPDGRPAQGSAPPSTLRPTLTAPAIPISLPSPSNTPILTVTPRMTATSTPAVKATALSTRTATPTVGREEARCPDGPDSLLKPGDWARVSVDPPMANKIRSQPGSSGQANGHVQPGANLLVVDGPLYPSLELLDGMMASIVMR